MLDWCGTRHYFVYKVDLIVYDINYTAKEFRASGGYSHTVNVTLLLYIV